MCGLIGIVSEGARVSPAALRAGMNAMKHRGPDGSGEWVAEHGEAGLGHVRLSIVGLACGAQPIANEDGRIRIVVTGELYDHERIRRELESRGHRFSTRSDSEIAVHLYEEMGPACLARLRGEFALVLWDDRTRTVFAARDRFGIKPLVYARSNGALLFASEAKALFAAGVEAGWDEESVFRTLFLCMDRSRSLFRGVRHLPPGHFLVSGPSGERLERYWDADYPATPRGSVGGRGSEGWSRSAGAQDAANAVDRARELVDEAVDLRCRADVPVGCLLSGGLDSSATLGFARRHVEGPLTAFTIAFDGREHDESDQARRTAERLGVEWHVLRVTEALAAQHFEDSVWHGEMIQYNQHGVARFLLSRMVRNRGIKTVLAGEGADEVFAGYHFCARALQSGASGGAARNLWRYAVARFGPKDSTAREIDRASPWLGVTTRFLRLPTPLLASLATKVGWIRTIVDAEGADVVGVDPFRAAFDDLDPREQLRGREPVKQILYLWLNSVFVNYVLAAERLDMAHGVEVRLPFLDHELFEWARTLPGSLLARGGQQKWVLREAARSVVPDEVYRGVKHGFFAPPAALERGRPMFDMVDDLLSGPGLDSIPFIRPPAVRAFLDSTRTMSPSDRRAAEPLLLAMASLAVLGDRYRL